MCEIAGNVYVGLQFVDLIDGAACSMNNCIGDVCFDGRPYMLSVKIMSEAFRDLTTASRKGKCAVRSE